MSKENARHRSRFQGRVFRRATPSQTVEVGYFCVREVRVFVGIEQKIGRAAAGGVGCHLPAELRRGFGHLKQILFGDREDAAIIGIDESIDLRVGAPRFAQIRGADENPAVEDGLQVADAKPIVAPAGDERDALDLCPAPAPACPAPGWCT